MGYMLRDKTLIVVFGLGLFILIVAALLVVYSLPSGNSNLILHFTAGSGVNLLGSRVEVLATLGVIFAVGVVNLLLAREIYYRERFLSYLLAFATFTIAILSLIAAGVIVSVN